jgi:hypothetical protein
MCLRAIMVRATVLAAAIFILAMMPAESFAQSWQKSHTSQPSLVPSSADQFKKGHTAKPYSFVPTSKPPAMPVPQQDKAKAVGYAVAPVEKQTGKAKAVGYSTPVQKQKDKAKAAGLTCVGACMKKTNDGPVSINQEYLKNLCTTECKRAGSN